MAAITKTCNCPADAEETYGGVTVTGHELALCLLGEPRQYTWKTAGAPRTGTLGDYANEWAGRVEDDCLNELGTDVLLWGDTLVLHEVEVTRLADEEPYTRYRLAVGNEAVIVSVDDGV
jgi:hypothetical protein